MSASLRVSTAACVACVAVLCAAAFGLVRPEKLIEQSYSNAFDRIEVGGPGGSQVDPSYLHLSANAEPIRIGPQLAVGDRITLSQRSGETSSFEILDVRPLSASALGSAAELPQMLVVTAFTSGGQLPVQTIRFLVDATARPSEVPVVKPHAL